jgi:hypothetical protein
MTDSIEHPCHACGEPIDALAVLDGRATPGPEKRCPECRTPLRVLRALADGYVDRDDLEQKPDGRYHIPASVRDELAERIDEMDDPAEENEYLRELGVAR